VTTLLLEKLPQWSTINSMIFASQAKKHCKQKLLTIVKFPEQCSTQCTLSETLFTRIKWKKEIWWITFISQQRNPWYTSRNTLLLLSSITNGLIQAQILMTSKILKSKLPTQTHPEPIIQIMIQMIPIGLTHSCKNQMTQHLNHLKKVKVQSHSLRTT